MFAPNRFATGLCWSPGNGGGQGRAATMQQEPEGTIQALEYNNPAHRSRNLYEHNTTGVFDSADLDMTVIAALQYVSVPIPKCSTIQVFVVSAC
jgi:hypothetical protein